MATDLSQLPGGALVVKGLDDLARGRQTIESHLVAIAATRLRSLGLDVPSDVPRESELLLYRKLRDDGTPDAYSRYNALLRELVSFGRALEARVEH